MCVKALAPAAARFLPYSRHSQPAWRLVCLAYALFLSRPGLLWQALVDFLHFWMIICDVFAVLFTVPKTVTIRMYTLRRPSIPKSICHLITTSGQSSRNDSDLQLRKRRRASGKACPECNQGMKFSPHPLLKMAVWSVFTVSPVFTARDSPRPARNYPAYRCRLVRRCR